MSLVGMDIENVLHTSTRFKAAADSIRHDLGQLSNLVHNASWQGPDAERFRGDQWNTVRVRLLEAAEILEGAGVSAQKNAKDQEHVSQR